MAPSGYGGAFFVDLKKYAYVYKKEWIKLILAFYYDKFTRIVGGWYGK